MIDGLELVCDSPSESFSLSIRTKKVRLPGIGEILVRVNMSSVNPIDAKRATGYGRTLLALKGAAGKTIVLGNDFAGTVQAVAIRTEQF